MQETEQPMTAEQILELKSVLESQRATTEQILPYLPALRTLLADAGEAEAVRIHNVLEFATLYGYDFSCILEDTVDHQGSRRALVYARFLILLVYEASQKLRQLLGGQFQEDLRAFGYGEESIKTVRRIHKCFVDAFERCNSEFGDVRDGIVAHRDESAERQMELIEVADVPSVIDMTLQMERCVVQLGAMLWVHLQNQSDRYRLVLGDGDEEVTDGEDPG